MTNLRIRISKINLGNAGFLIGTIVLLASSFLAIKFVHKQFGSYDVSPAIDLSWRLANNQIPGKDFINTLPPLFIVFVKFISWGSLRWVDLTIINIIATGGTFLFLYLVSDHREESIFWGLFIAIILAIPLVYSNHIWPSTLSQLSGIIFFYSVYVAINSNRPDTKVLLGILLASGFLAISKQNVALPMMLTVVVFLLFLKRQDRIILIAFILIGAVSGVVLSMFYLGYSLDSFIHSYSAVLGRTKLDLLMLHFATMPYSNYPLPLLIPGVVFLLIYSMYEKGSNTSKINKIYFLLMLAVSLIPAITNWDGKLNDVSLPLFILTTGIFLSIRMSVDNSTAGQHCHYPMPRILITFAVILMIYASSIYFGYIRERMFLNGAFFEFYENVTIDKGYFSGLRTGNIFPGVLNDIVQAKSEYPYHKIFFGPFMEFGYLYTKSQSPHGMPLWWHPGTSYGMSDEKKIIENFIQAKFDVVIFFKGQRFRMPAKLLIYIIDNYSMDNTYKYIDLYIKTNPNSPLPYYIKGKAYAKIGQYELAIKDYTEAIRLKPDYTEAYNNRGAVYLNQGNNQMGCLDARKACELGHCKILELAKSNGVCH